MNKLLWLTTGLILATVTITGCSTAAGAETGTTEKAGPRLQDSWPTTQPTVTLAQPTPFPRITLVPTATPEPRHTTEPEASPTPLSAGGYTFSGSVGDIQQQVSALTGGYEPVAVSFVTDASQVLRQGPSNGSAQLAPVEMGELAGVLGTNAGGDWLYVITIVGNQGWLPASSLRITGSLDEAPVLPDNPVAAAVGAGSGQEATASGSPSPPMDVSFESLEAVASATVDNAALNLRQGPGAGYGLLATLAQGDAVSILGLNGAGDWAAVRTTDGRTGWVSLPFLKVEGDLSQAPHITSPSAAGSPGDAGQAAPLPESADAGISIPELTEVAAAKVLQPESKLFRQPFADATKTDQIFVDQAVSVLAVNGDRTWALVKPDGGTPGWTPLSTLEVAGSLDAAPMVATAWVQSNGVEVRSGPGVYFDPAGRLGEGDLVALLGQADNQGWALVKPILGGGVGWTPFHFLDIHGSWNDVPKLANDVLAAQSSDAASASPGPAIPAPSGDPTGLLALQLSSGGDIVLINADGSNLHRLTSGIDPVLSPDGTQVAFTRWEYGGESSALWTINADGTNERAILGEMRKAKGPDWSPDGSRIILNSQDGGRLEPQKQCVPLVDEGSGNMKRPAVPSNAFEAEVEMKDGMPFLCWKVPADAFWSLRVIEVTDGTYDGTYGGRYAFRPAWDPSNDWRVVVDSGHGLLETDANQTDAASSRGLTDKQSEGSPAVSPDGRFIASVVADNGAYDIHRLNADGSGRVRLTETPLWVTGRGLERWNNVAPAWSPDGSRIAFLTDRNGRWEVWVMNADGGNPHPLFSDEINDQLPIQYDFNDERVISWR